MELLILSIIIFLCGYAIGIKQNTKNKQIKENKE